MRVTVKYIQFLVSALEKINAVPLEELTIETLTGDEVQVSKETADWRREQGMSNIEFVTSGAYLEQVLPGFYSHETEAMMEPGIYEMGTEYEPETDAWFKEES